MDTKSLMDALNAYTEAKNHGTLTIDIRCALAKELVRIDTHDPEATKPLKQEAGLNKDLVFQATYQSELEKLRAAPQTITTRAQHHGGLSGAQKNHDAFIQ